MIEYNPPPELEVVDKNANPLVGPAKAVVKMLGKTVVATIVLASELAVVGFIGSVIGSYMTAKTAVADCHTVNLAKIGDVYVTCKLVDPIKDTPSQPPR